MQDKISKLTYSVVDTTQNQTQQAKDVYNWLTNNIVYDIKQYVWGTKDHTPEQVLKHKRAVCYGFSGLFHEMCKVLDIESYIIYGYSKGFGYVKGNPFIKSNHSWNIIHPDSSWIIVDATWGSGGLYYEYKFFTWFKRFILGKESLKTKIRFQKEPTDSFYNIKPEAIIKTHFPIDSKWQLLDYPITYESFILDSNTHDSYLNYEKEIAMVKLKDVQYQCFIDALNSIKYNPKNRFDIGIQYYNQANQLNITKRSVLDSTLLEPLKKSLEYYDSSIVNLRKFKSISRTFYKTRKLEHKNSYRLARTTIKKFTKVPTVENNRYLRAYNKQTKKEEAFESQRREIIMTSSLITDSSYFSFDSVSILDTLKYNEYTTKVELELTKANNKMAELNTSLKNIESIYNEGKYQTDTILFFLNQTNQNIINIQKSINKMDEYSIFYFCDKITPSYQSYDSILIAKKEIEKRLKDEMYKIQSSYQSTEQTLGSLKRLYERLAEITGKNNKYNEEARKVNDMLRQILTLKLEAITYLRHHNDNWKILLDKQDEMLSVHGAKGLMNISNQLTEFHNHTADYNDKMYAADVKIYENIRDDIKKQKAKKKEALRTVQKNIKMAGK